MLRSCCRGENSASTVCFFFQAEDGIRDHCVTGVQTCALPIAAPTLGFLIAARALQGLGGALIMSISPAMLTRAFAASERGRALGLNAVVVALGVSTGPTLGGIITANLSWRWIFFVNLPIGIV